jgi:hypothetical protein
VPVGRRHERHGGALWCRHIQCRWRDDVHQLQRRLCVPVRVDERYACRRNMPGWYL